MDRTLTRESGRAKEAGGSVVTWRAQVGNVPAQPSRQPPLGALRFQPDGSSIPVCNQRKRKSRSVQRRKEQDKKSAMLC